MEHVISDPDHFFHVLSHFVLKLTLDSDSSAIFFFLTNNESLLSLIPTPALWSNLSPRNCLFLGQYVPLSPGVLEKEPRQDLGHAWQATEPDEMVLLRT